MKKLGVSISIYLLTFSAVFAQTEKGKFLIGAGSDLGYSYSELGFESDDSDFEKSLDISSYNLSLLGGYFVDDHFLLGTSIGFSYSNRESDTIDSANTSIMFNPFARYYFGSDKTKYFINGGIGFGNSRVEFFENEIDFNLFGYQLGGGVAIFLRKNISIDIGLEYSYLSSEQRENNDNDEKLVTKGFNSNVGLSFYL